MDIGFSLHIHTFVHDQVGIHSLLMKQLVSLPLELIFKI